MNDSASLLLRIEFLQDQINHGSPFQEALHKELEETVLKLMKCRIQRHEGFSNVA